ncbi:MAG: Raf kinase inhibitor-like YbhB/YbcL family protein [Candidatus Nanohaloarchaea archaeon]|jgi:Raf kinase inhibitor-like YbhB/YbcL family protein
MKLTSPGFQDGGDIPEKHGYPKENVNPALEISGVPDNAESLVLLMDDPDAREPAGKIWDHWTVWNIDSSISEISEGESPGVEGMTDFGSRGYGGPNPPDGTHTYRFRVYALDTELDLPEDSTKADVMEAMKDHVLDQAQLEGKYDPV